jgi:membrane-bound lytic murein transglycosylase C
MQLRKVLSICIPLILFPLASTGADIFDDFDAEIEIYEHPDVDKEMAEYAKFVTAYLNEYDQWRSQYLSEFDKKQAEVIKKWGTVEQKKNVSYSEDAALKSIVDYENNEVIVEMLVDDSLSEKEAQKVLSEKISLLVNDKSSNLSAVNSKGIIIIPEAISTSEINYSKEKEAAAKKIIDDQTAAYLQDVDKNADKILLENESISPKVVEEIVAKKKVKLKEEAAIRIAAVESTYQALRQNKPATPSKALVKEHKPTLKIVKYKVKLPANSLGNRAKNYTDFAETESQRFDIPVALIMAIMHSESAFDPKAKSAVPAYGLMQIVPRTAGHDVNKLVRHIDKPMKAKELYIPDVNVETGSAYLSILDKRYLKSIKDPTSRLYCTIAAYNTGAGNVAKVFNKKGHGNTRNINRAAKVINTLSSQQVYDELMKKLPYDETKHYLKKVSSRIALYQVKA